MHLCFGSAKIIIFILVFQQFILFYSHNCAYTDYYSYLSQNNTRRSLIPYKSVAHRQVLDFKERIPPGCLKLATNYFLSITIMKKINYQTPEVLVTDLNLEGMLCQSSLDVSAASIEEWENETFSW